MHYSTARTLVSPKDLSLGGLISRLLVTDPTAITNRLPEPWYRSASNQNKYAVTHNGQPHLCSKAGLPRAERHLFDDVLYYVIEPTDGDKKSRRQRTFYLRVEL